MCFVSRVSRNFVAIILLALALGTSYADSNAYRRVDRKLKDDQQTCATTVCSSFVPDEGKCAPFLQYCNTMHLWLLKFNNWKSEDSTLKQVLSILLSCLTTVLFLFTLTGMNCIYKCSSPVCYESVYGKEPIEDGEIDHHRYRLFSLCVRQKTLNITSLNKNDSATQLND